MKSNLKWIYICSPLRGDLAANMDRAREYCRRAMAEGHMPIAPHLHFTQFLDDNIPEERALGMAYGLELLPLCDEIWVFGPTSEGMRAEIELAWASGVVVVEKT